jgi:SCY1-like protein 2
VAKGLQFLHDSVKLVHGNLNVDAIVINAKGDWKISGFALSTYLASPSGEPARWEFPEQDSRLPPSLQKDLDYIGMGWRPKALDDLR